MNKFAKMILMNKDDEAGYSRDERYDREYRPMPMMDYRGRDMRGMRDMRRGRRDYAEYEDMAGGRSGMRVRNDMGEYDMRGRSARTGRYTRDGRRGDRAGYEDMRGRGDGRRGRRSDRNSGDYGDYGMYEPEWELRRYREDYGYGGDYGMEHRHSTYAPNPDYGYGDYGEDGEFFTEKDLKEWKKELKNADGTKGAHFKEEQVKQAAQKVGIEMKDFDEDIFCMAMNMIYSDYCEVAKEHGVDKPEFYAEMAEAFLCDEDYSGSAESKLYIYWKAIAEAD